MFCSVACGTGLSAVVVDRKSAGECLDQVLSSSTKLKGISNFNCLLFLAYIPNYYIESFICSLIFTTATLLLKVFDRHGLGYF